MAAAAGDRFVIPAGHQLRELLADQFRSLARLPRGYVVTLADGSRYVDADPEVAYLSAVLKRTSAERTCVTATARSFGPQPR